MAFIATNDRDELLSTLTAYERIAHACWPSLHPDLTGRTAWGPRDEKRLRASLSALLDESAVNALGVRVFWKLLPSLSYRGANLSFARDGGLSSIEEIIGLDDFSPRVPWNRQAPLYRRDDELVIKTREEKLFIIERQDQLEQTTYLHTAKVPMLGSDGGAIGLLGMYRLIDKATAVTLMREHRT